ncbi:MAG: hemolysin family protein [Acidobacteriota bacterium]
MHPLLFYTGLLALFLLLSAFFSGSETAFMTVNRLRLRHRAQSGDRKAALVKEIADNPDRLLGVILLGNTITNVAAASILTYVATTYVPRDRADDASLVASVILTLVILIFCELTPKMIAATHSERMTNRIIWPVRLSVMLLSPFARMAGFCANIILRVLGLSAGASPFAHALSEEEVRALIGASSASNLADEKRAMLRRVFDIGATQVREVMLPRTEVTAVDLHDPFPEILSVIQKSNYSRIPVYRESFDNILGILNAKDLLQHLHQPGEISLRALLRPAHFVPDTARLESVLRQLQAMHLHMAVVVDEFGGVEGIVTLEDLLEEIVGEIRDEHDVEPEVIRELGPQLYSVAGHLPVREFNRAFPSKIPESREYTTVAGFLQALSGKLLRDGESVRYQELSFTIEKTEGFKVVSLRVRVPLMQNDAAG